YCCNSPTRCNFWSTLGWYYKPPRIAMKRGNRQSAVFFIALLLGISATYSFAHKKHSNSSMSALMDPSKRALHLLNPLSFVTRAGDIHAVEATGTDRCIGARLHPDKINDAASDARLSPFRTRRMDTKEIVDNCPPTPVIRAVANGKQSLP